MEFNTDHRAVVAIIAIKLTQRRRSRCIPRYIKKLQDPELQQRYAVKVFNCFSALSEEEQDLHFYILGRSERCCKNRPELVVPIQK